MDSVEGLEGLEGLERGRMLRRGLPVLWDHVRAQPVTYVISLGGATLYAAAAVGTAVVLRRITDEVVIPAFGDGGITDQATRAGALLMLGVGALKGLSILLRRYFAALTTFRSQARLRRKVTNHYLDVPLSFHRSKPAGELLAHADADVLGATEVLNALPFTVGVLALIAFAVVSLLLVDPVLTGIALLLFPSLALLNRVYTSRVEQPVSDVQARVGDVSGIAHESFDGALAVKTLGIAEHESERMAIAADALRQARVRVGRIRATFEPAIDAIPNFGQIGLLLIGSWRVSSGVITPGDLVQGVALFSLLAFPMRVVGFFLQELPRAVVSTDRISRATTIQHGIPPTPQLPSSAAAPSLPDGPLTVELDGVGFAYEAETPVLRDVSFAVDAGETVAIVGATGSGKSTLCELLVGLAPASSGQIRIGGHDLADLGLAELREAVTLVFQEPFLFADSLAGNVGVPDVTGSDSGSRVSLAATVAAASMASAHEFIDELPDRYDTVVGERGVTLSGGQRQRVALARALVREPQVLILDDATSAVDPVVEAEILAALRQGFDTTTLIVAHRLSTILLADRVVFMEHGTVVGEGTHEELLRIPAYERIVRAYEASEVS